LKRNTIIVIGLIILTFIVINWTGELNWLAESPLGHNPERAAQLRAGINQKNGIWFVFVLMGTAVLAAIARTTARKSALTVNDEEITSEAKEIEPVDKHTAKSYSGSIRRERMKTERKQIQADLAKLQERLARLEEE